MPFLGGQQHKNQEQGIQNLEQVGDVLALFPHGLGAAKWRIGSHMDPLLLAPVYRSVIAPVTMDLHL